MKRSILILAATAALLAGGASAAQAATSCYSINVPAVPAVYETVVIPAVTVTEYEFIHAQDGNGNSNGQGPEVKWTEDANWNSQGNAHSIGWTATGNTRVRVLEVERTVVNLVSPEVPASVVEECVQVPDVIYPSPEEPGVVTIDPVPASPGSVDPAPVTEPAPAAPVAAPVAVRTAPLADVGAQPVAAVQAPPAELAYTGAADWVLPAGLALLALGGAAVLTSRKFSIK